MMVLSKCHHMWQRAWQKKNFQNLKLCFYSTLERPQISFWHWISVKNWFFFSKQYLSFLIPLFSWVFPIRGDQEALGCRKFPFEKLIETNVPLRKHFGFYKITFSHSCSSQVWYFNNNHNTEDLLRPFSIMMELLFIIWVSQINERNKRR